MRMKREGLMGTRVWYLAINVISLHLLQGSVSEAGCPTNAGIHSSTKQRNGVCYVFFQTTKTWDQARNACHSKGGYLVIIPDSSTQNFLVASLRSLNWPRHGVWIGATDRDEEGQWIWEGTSVRLSYKNWSPNQIRQPSAGRSGSKETKSNDREDCAQIRMMDAGRWHDFPCNVSSSYICQFGSVSRPTTTKRVRTTHAARVTTQRRHARTVMTTAKVAPIHPLTTVKAATTSKRTLTTVRAVATSKHTSTTVKTGATSERISATPATTPRHSVSTRNMISFAQSSKTPITVRPLTGSSKTPTRTFTSSPSTARPAKVVHSTSLLTTATVRYKFSTATPSTSFAANSTPSSGSPSSSLHPKPEDTGSKSSVRIATRPTFTTSKLSVSTASTSDKATSLRAASTTTATSHRIVPSVHTTAGKPVFTLPPARTPASSSTSHSSTKRETKLTQAAGVRSSSSSRTTTAHYGPRRTARPPAVPHSNHLYTTRSTLHREALSKEGKSPGTVAGIVLGSLFGVVIIVAAVYIIWSKSKSPKLHFPDHDVAFENFSYGSSVLLKTDTYSSSFS